MDDDAQSLTHAIGARVKQERQRLGWTLDRLAEAAHVSRRMLVNVEQGSVNAGIATLLRLSDALGVGLPQLVAPPAPRPVQITRRGDGARLWAGPDGGSGILLAGTESPDVVELWEWTLMAGEGHDSEAHAAGTRELLRVENGCLVVHVDGADHELRAGDAMSFWSDVPHGYRAAAETPVTRFVMTVFEPGVAPATRKDAAHG